MNNNDAGKTDNMIRLHHHQCRGKLMAGRWIIVLCITLYLLMIALLTGPMHENRTTILQGMGVPAMQALFVDTLCVAHWCDAYAVGDDPRRADFKNDTGKIITMNYPVYFLALHYVGLTAQTIVVFGIVLGVLFLGSVLLLAGKCSLAEGFIWSMALCSPVAVMIVERGNLDIIIFALLVLSLIMRDHPFASAGSIFLATVLKFYPLPSFISLIMRPNPRWILFLCFVFGGCSAIAFGIAVTGHASSKLDLSSCCFGSKLIPLIMADRGMKIPSSLPIIFQGASLALLSLSVWIGKKLHPRDSVPNVSWRSLCAFWIGAPVYLLVFLSGDQADYKMVMLLFALPLLLSWRESHAPYSRISWLWLCLFFAYNYWLFFSDEGSLRNQLLRQVIAWGLFLLTGFIAGSLIPSASRLFRQLKVTV